MAKMMKAMMAWMFGARATTPYATWY